MASNRLRRDREKIVILDSSALMMPFEFSIDVEKELTNLLGTYSIIIPTSVVQELTRLSEQGNGRKKMMAQASLKLIERYTIVDSEGVGDDAVFSLALKMKGIVVTNDRELRGRLTNISLPVIFLRAKKKLAME